MIPNSILNVGERALREALQNQIYQNVPNIPIYRSDEAEQKQEQPYLIIHCEEAEEELGPGTGIYRISITVTFRSHVKPTSPDERDAVITAINNFVYSNPAEILSQVDGFHCYGFMPIRVHMGVNTELKSYEYINEFELHCMPRNNN